MTTKDVRDVLHYSDQTPLWLVQGKYTWGKSLTLIGAINNAELEDGDACVVMLAWWNADKCGGFDLTDMWGVDTAIARDMVTVFGLVSRLHSYPDGSDPTLAEFEAGFRSLVDTWRPDLGKE